MNVDSLYTHLIFTIIELWTFLSPPKYLYHFPYSTSPIPSNPLQPQVTIGIFLPLRIGFVFSGVKYTFSSLSWFPLTSFSLSFLPSVDLNYFCHMHPRLVLRTWDPFSYTGYHPQEGPILYLMLCCCQLDFFFFLVGLHLHCGTQASGLSCPEACWDLSSLTSDRTHVPYLGRQILDHWTTREIAEILKKNLNKGPSILVCMKSTVGARHYRAMGHV